MREELKKEDIIKEIVLLQEELDKINAKAYYYLELYGFPGLSEITITYPLEDFKSRKTRDKDILAIFENFNLSKYFRKDGGFSAGRMGRRDVTFYNRIRKYIIV